MTPHRLRVSWTIPAPVILAILGQVLIIGWVGAAWKTTIEKDMEKDRLQWQSQFHLYESRLAVLERSVINNEAVVERVTRVEEQVGSLKEQGVRIENKLDTALERRR